MPRQVAKPLTAAKIANAKPGRYADGGNLYLLVRAPTQKWWCFRYRRGGRMKEMGLGAAVGTNAVSLVKARAKAREQLDLHRDGYDPLALRRARIEALRVAEARLVTFKAAAEGYIKAHAVEWRNAKHAGQWSTTLATYAYPKLGSRAVSAITRDHVLAVLQPIWLTKTETASRLRGRIEIVLDFAKAHGWREGDNPAAWADLKHTLPARNKVQKTVRHAALPYAEIAAFMVELRQQQGMVARALEFAILTAARTGEVTGATWDEIDLAAMTWTIPAGRMKAEVEHRVPLSPPVLALLGSKAGDGPLFPGLRDTAMLELLRRMGVKATTHGFRSTFRTWAAEQTTFPPAVAEMALAHSIGSAVEKAYNRSDLLAQRRQLADAWALHCATPQQQKGGANNVTTLKRARR